MKFKNMKPSLFNVFGETGDTQTPFWVYNTLSTGCCLLSEEERELLENFDSNTEYGQGCEEVFKIFKEFGYLIDEEIDELVLLQSFRKEVIKSNKKIADIIVAPTMDCNARCYYCFEHGCHHEKMNQETADQFVKFIKENWNEEKISINWFGGEPLIATDVIDYIVAGLINERINFISKITTNGLALTESVIAKCLNSWNVNKIQISMDALGEEYNKIKNYIDTSYESPFDQVIENVFNALESGLKIRIRININPNNLVKGFELMEFLQRKFSSYSNFSAYYAVIDADSKVSPCISKEFPDRQIHPFLEIVDNSRLYGGYGAKPSDPDRRLESVKPVTVTSII